MTLIERLKQPALDKLQLANIKYPLTIGNVFDKLENLQFWTEIPYGTWIDIQAFTGAEHLSDIFTDNI